MIIYQEQNRVCEKLQTELFLYISDHLFHFHCFPVDFETSTRFFDFEDFGRVLTKPQIAVLNNAFNVCSETNKLELIPN